MHIYEGNSFQWRAIKEKAERPHHRGAIYIVKTPDFDHPMAISGFSHKTNRHDQVEQNFDDNFTMRLARPETIKAIGQLPTAYQLRIVNGLTIQDLIFQQ